VETSGRNIAAEKDKKEISMLLHHVLRALLDLEFFKK